MINQQSSVPSQLNAQVDVSPDFFDFKNTVFVAKSVASFDAATGHGAINWERNCWKMHYGFNHMRPGLEVTKGNEFPGIEYAVNPQLPFSIEFTSARTIRLRLRTGETIVQDKEPSLMLVNEPAVDRSSWKYTRHEKSHEYSSAFGKVIINEDPWRIEIRDKDNRLLTQTGNRSGSLPFSFIRRASDYSRSVAGEFALSPGEKIMGLGESFGPVDKRGQKLILYTTDVISAERPQMYKPIPFFLSNRGYGMFIHTSSPITADVGQMFFSDNILFVGDDSLDLFIFLGDPKEILNEYTTLTGKSPMPPLWSFGLWMSRITYKEEKEVRDVGAKMREHKVPCDVIHLDTGWFQTDWRCEYQFAADRFPNPQGMIDDLKKQGYRISLWQLPYFVPKNPLFREIVEKGLYVKDPRGGVPGEDVILDFSNPAAVKWYQDHLGNLLKMGVAAIKTDFGEAAPVNGIYASGKSGFYEHNLYPLRYQKAVADITKATTGGDVIWARAGWAGSQRYPLHWSGDSNTRDTAMCGTLRAGLSLGTCGFTFWSHDIGGFFGRPNNDLYNRWAAWGLLTAHSRCHGDPPREPYEFGDAFQNDFRNAVEMKYRLMPYIYTESKIASDSGLPMFRALYIEFPNDPGSWNIDDQYLLGSKILIAPMLEAGQKDRDVYLPPGEWVDYQSGKRYTGGTYHRITPGKVAAVVLVRAGTVLPHVKVAQSTDFIDWNEIELQVYPASGSSKCEGQIYLPGMSKVESISVEGDRVIASDTLTKRLRIAATKKS